MAFVGNYNFNNITNNSKTTAPITKQHLQGCCVHLQELIWFSFCNDIILYSSTLCYPTRSVLVVFFIMLFERFWLAEYNPSMCKVSVNAVSETKWRRTFFVARRTLVEHYRVVHYLFPEFRTDINSVTWMAATQLYIWRVSDVSINDIRRRRILVEYEFIEDFRWMIRLNRRLHQRWTWHL